MSSGLFTQISQTTGDQNSASQVLTQNYLAYNNNISLGSYFTYLYPVYTLEGASLNYYGIDYNSISYDITNGKLYTLFFSGESTSSVIGHSGSTLITHSLYCMPFSAYTLYVQNPEAEDFPFGDIANFLNTPLLSLTEPVSSITISNSAYTYSFPTLYKDVGNFTLPVFEDKNQYLLDTLFSFEESNDLTIGDCLRMTPNVFDPPERVYLEPSATTFYTSNLGEFEISGDTPFSGFTVNGAFFTYFVPPKKPNLNVSLGRQQISVEGPQTNLSPVFNFANVDDGDYYKLQVNYNTGDTPYSGTEIYTYEINKQVGDAEFVRVFSTPLNANDDFIYRIGNTKEIINIFGNKQSITTWSDSVSASISASGKFYFSGYTWRNYISNTFNGVYHISGMTIVANTLIPTTYVFDTVENLTMTNGRISAATDGSGLITIEYNGTLYTEDWRNALYSSTSWSNLGIYIVDDSPNTAITDSNFTINTITQGMPNASVTLQQIYGNTELDLAIDQRSSRSTTFTNRDLYQQGISNGVTLSRISGPNGYFDFGFVRGGYYRLTVQPSASYPAYEPIDIFITINSNLGMDLILSIIWGNQTFTFDDLQNDTFL